MANLEGVVLGFINRDTSVRFGFLRGKWHGASKLSVDG